MTPAVGRKMPLMRPPAKLGRLRTLAEKPVDRPGVDELADRLGDRGDLGVALGDVDDLDPKPLGEAGPAGAVAGDRRRGIVEPRQVDERLLDEMRHEPGVGAVRQHRGRPAGIARAQCQRAFAQRVIRALRRREIRVGIAARATARCRCRDKARPWPEPIRSARRSPRRPRRWSRKSPGPSSGSEHRAVIGPGERHFDKVDTVFGGDRVAARLGGDNGDPLGRDADMAQDKRQRRPGRCCQSRQ